MITQRFIDGAPGGIMLICEHAANTVPPDLDLAVAPDLLGKHIAIDIGAAALTEALAAELGAPEVLATVSRLVVDLNRQPDHPALIPEISDGHIIPGNALADRADRIARFHAPFHRAVAARVGRDRPVLLVGVHSFTPKLESSDAAPRPWRIGILSNRDRRAADQALALLGQVGLSAGDNEPYSGRILNATLDRHGEANGIASLTIEVRNDRIADPGGVASWTAILAPILTSIGNGLASNRQSAT